MDKYCFGCRHYIDSNAYYGDNCSWNGNFKDCDTYCKGENCCEHWEEKISPMCTGWEDIEYKQPKDGTLVLCKVEGLPFTEFIVSDHTEEGWWIYVPSLGEQFKGGWCCLPESAKITHWQYIQF